MSKTTNLRNELRGLAMDCGGSDKTVSARLYTAGQFVEFCRTNNIQIKAAASIKPRHVAAFIESMKPKQGDLTNKQRRTLQNKITHMRRMLDKTGKTKLAASRELSCEALGIAKANRDGTKRAIDSERLQNAIEQSHRDGKRGLSAVYRLSEALGLRVTEAVMSGQSLKRWLRDLQAGRDQTRVIHGTKGGRSRWTAVIDRDKAIAAIKYALPLITKDRRGHEVFVPGNSLEAAVKYVSNHSARCYGLQGDQSPHSIRYNYACNRYDQLIKSGLSHRETVSVISMDLGHGEGRIDYVLQVYLRR